MSPTILRTKNLKIKIYPKDHQPPHLHVIGPEVEAKFLLENFECLASTGFSKKAIKEISNYLKKHKKILEAAWHEFQ